MLSDKIIDKKGYSFNKANDSFFDLQPQLTTRSPLRYPGGKSRAVSAILPYIPAGTKKICSPFFGGGSLELALMNRGMTILGSDIFPPLVDFWQETIKNPIKLSKQVQKYFPLLKNKFYTLQKNYTSLPDQLQRAAVFFVLNRCSFSGTTLSGGMSPGHPRFTPSAIDRLRNFHSVGLTVKQADYKVALRENADILAYLDPPYLIESDNLYGARGDTHKGFNHEELASILKMHDRWILSYNDCLKIRKFYKYARIFKPRWAYGMSNSKKSAELLIISPSLSKRLSK